MHRFHLWHLAEGCISETLKYRKLVLGRYFETIMCRTLILGRGCKYATSWCDLDLTFDLAVVTLTCKVLPGLYVGNCKVWEVYSRDIHCASSWCDLISPLTLLLRTCPLRSCLGYISETVGIVGS